MDQLVIMMEKRKLMMKLLDEGKKEEAKRVFEEISRLYEQATGNSFKEKFLSNEENKKILEKVFITSTELSDYPTLKDNNSLQNSALRDDDDIVIE